MQSEIIESLTLLCRHWYRINSRVFMGGNQKERRTKVPEPGLIFSGSAKERELTDEELIRAINFMEPRVERQLRYLCSLPPRPESNLP